MSNTQNVISPVMSSAGRNEFVVASTLASAQAVVLAAAVSAPAITSGQDLGGDNYQINGTSAPGAFIRLFDGPLFIGAGFADSTGHWSIEPFSPLDYGTHGLTATARTDGVTGEPSTPFALAVGFDLVYPEVVSDIPVSAFHMVDLADPSAYFQDGSGRIEGAASGISALHLTGDHQVLDLTALTGKTTSAQVSGFGVVDLG